MKEVQRNALFNPWETNNCLINNEASTKKCPVESLGLPKSNIGGWLVIGCNTSCKVWYFQINYSASINSRWMLILAATNWQENAM